MKGLTAETIAGACGGTALRTESVAGREITQVTCDSRTVKEGALYVPMKGERADGHSFIPAAFENGAMLVLTEREEAAAGYPCILVGSTAEAIQRLAEYYLKVLGTPVVGVTGSVGKTSTKEMIASVLSRRFRTLWTEGNFNNNLGLPLTVFRLTGEEEIAVLEMGISHFGEMTDLARTARPDVMVITNIGECHLEFLGDRDGVFRAKTECFPYLKERAVVILNGEDDKLAEVESVNGMAPVFYGRDPSFRVYADDIRPLGLEGTVCTLNIDDRSFEVRIPIPGGHMVMNALAAAAVGAVMGLDDGEIREGIEAVTALSGRLRIEKEEGLTVINDCYNANPVSMKASLSVLADAEGRRAAVLGDMGELGEAEADLHREVGRYAASLPIDLYLLAGGKAGWICEGIKEEDPGAEVFLYDTADLLIADLSSHIRRGDTVLVKASHSMHFEKIVDALRQGNGSFPPLSE